MEIKRDSHLKRLISAKHNGMIKIVTGVRRCGKSYLLFKLFCDHLNREGVPSERIVKVDLEDRRNKALRDPDALLAYIDSRISGNEMHYVLIDEIQLVPEFEDVLNSYLKLPNVDVYVTGSNSRFLSTDVITEFRGRGYEIRIAPLSFSEFLPAFDGSREEALAEYMTYGGMPKIVDFKEPKEKAEYLKGLFENAYIKDVKERHSIRNDGDLNELIDTIASSIGGLTNPNKLANTFASVKRSKISAHTIKSYLEILQDAFLIEKSLRYDIKGKRYISAPAKYYFCDIGLRNARINFRQHEVSHLMENLVYNELRLRGMSVDVGSVTFNSKNEQGASSRTALEIDFVCNQGSKRCYVQSALRLPSSEKLEQEIRPLKSVSDNFSKFVITEDPIKSYQDENGIVFMNIFEFLLSEDSLSV